MSKEEEDYQRYRYLVLFHLPHLKFLDSRPVTPAVSAECLLMIRFPCFLLPYRKGLMPFPKIPRR